MIRLVQSSQGIALEKQDALLLTPKKNTLLLPNIRIAEAVARELSDGNPYTPRNKPLTAIAYTAIDVVANERASLIEALLAYAETDLLCCRAENPKLLALEEEYWQPVIAFVQHRYECHVEVMQGMMPLDQPAHTLERFYAALEAMSDMALSAVSVLVQLYGSLLLALAVWEEGIEASDAFTLSRLEEDFQTEQWGADPLMIERTEILRKEAEAAGMFLEFVRQ